MTRLFFQDFGDSGQPGDRGDEKEISIFQIPKGYEMKINWVVGSNQGGRWLEEEWSLDRRYRAASLDGLLDQVLFSLRSDAQFETELGEWENAIRSAIYDTSEIA